MVRLEKSCEERVLFTVFFHLVTRHGLRVLEVVQDVVVAWVKPQGRLVIVNGEAELAAPEVGVAQIVVEVGIFDSVVATGAPFVNGAIKVTFVVCLGASLDAVAMFCGETCRRKSYHHGEKDKYFQFHIIPLVLRTIFPRR